MILRLFFKYLKKKLLGVSIIIVETSKDYTHNSGGRTTGAMTF